MHKFQYYDGGFVDIQAVAHGLRLKRIGTDKYQGNCPVCDYKNAFSLSLAKDREKLLAHCHANRCDMKPFLRSAYNRDTGLNSSYLARPSPRYVRAKESELAHDGDDDLPVCWQEERSDPDGPAAKYLRSRGITMDMPLTIVSDLIHNPETKTIMPCMTTYITRVGTPHAVARHITYLKEDGSGKADVTVQKRIYGSYSGGAVMLAPPGFKMAVSEGIESGLSFQQGTGIPTWAALSSGNIPNLILSPKPLAIEILIAADHDKAGLDAAYRAAERWSAEGRHVEICPPLEPDTDYNDLLMAALKEEDLL